MSRTIRIAPGRMQEHQPTHPERTGYREVGRFPDTWIEIREWPSAGSLKTTLEMQRRRESRNGDWRAWPARKETT